MGNDVNTQKREEVYRGKIYKIEHARQPDGRIFEFAHRAPGVRIIIAKKDERKVLLTKEFRYELNDWDYRLPGGKVFDTLEFYDDFREKNGDITHAALEKAKQEGAEEAGVDILDAKLVKKSTLGATVEWDLYVIQAVKWQPHEDGQQLKEDEQIEADNWFDYEKAKQMILEGRMQEERIALILLQWLERQK